ncbi:hypothetical protein LJK88_17105 [Paenibacillus sp. P26]|nr:hypothetical protein LJK88_17105 [Paenibacillus sp. P26]
MEPLPAGRGDLQRGLSRRRAPLFIQDVFVRPNIDEGCVEVWIDAVNTTSRLMEHFEVELEILPRNFTGPGIGPLTFQVAYAGPGVNYYRYKVELPAFRLWEPESPYLYTARVGLITGAERSDSRDRSFGMRKFHMDEQGNPKGTLYLNNRPVLLRGANEMGHLQQCVMKGDYDQLIDDILIAKLAHLNFYRITQRPVQEEIYDYFDRLGMMHQCDLPTFGFIRRNQFVEGVRQAAEMERLIRDHPSSVMVSLINEPSRTEKRRKGHRHLHRNELEAFFVAARQAIYVENPDRVVKNADGDYNPPTREGPPDFHCYNMWYTNNTIPVGKMYKGYLPAIRAGWKTGCGEYGTEGLDNEQLMRSRYPKEWRPSGGEEEWSAEPDPRRADLQSARGLVCRTADAARVDSGEPEASMSGDEADDGRLAPAGGPRRIHRGPSLDRRMAGRLDEGAGRGRPDSEAGVLHVQSLPGADSREPPMRQVEGLCGETLEIEAWLLNDTAEEYRPCRIVATLRDDTRDYGSYELAASPPRASARYAGTIRFTVPPVEDRRSLHMDACLLDDNGKPLNSERFTFEAFAKASRVEPQPVAWLDTEAELLCSPLGLPGEPYDAASTGSGPLVAASREAFERHRDSLLEKVREGATALLILNGPDSEAWDIGGTPVRTAKLRELYFLALQSEDPRLSWVKEDDFSYFYHLTNDRIDGISNCHLLGDGIEPMVFAYRPQNEPGAGGKEKPPIVGKSPFGSGQFVLVCLPLSGRVGYNPTLDRFLISILSERGAAKHARDC